VHPGFSPLDLLHALRNLVARVEDAFSSKTPSAALPSTPTTATALLEGLPGLINQLYTHLSLACKQGSVTWHADVRRAFAQERLLLLPPRDVCSDAAPSSNMAGRTQVSQNVGGQDRLRNRTAVSSASLSPQRRPKRLFASEAWWDVESELSTTKAATLSLQQIYGEVPAAEFFFLRVIGVRRCASRADIAQRLRESMNSLGPLSHWTEGISITDIEELEHVQTSSYFRPAGWRAPGEEEEQELAREDEEAHAQPRANFQPPPAARGSAHPPAWRSNEAAEDAERRAREALEADAAAKRRAAADAQEREERQRQQQQLQQMRQQQSRQQQQQQQQQAQQQRPQQNLQQHQQQRSQQQEVQQQTSQSRYKWQQPRQNEHRAPQPTQQQEGEPHRREGQVQQQQELSQQQQEPLHQQQSRQQDTSSPDRPRERRGAGLTWSRLQAQQQQQQQRQTSEQQHHAQGEETTHKSLLRGTRASAWAKFGKELEDSEVVESSDDDQLSSDLDDVDGVEARIAAIKVEVESRRLESERLKLNRQNAEEAKEHYLRILQQFYDNM